MPEENSEEEQGFEYPTPEEALQAYQEEIGDLENFYQNEQIRIQELERIDWADIQKIPSKREIWEKAQSKDFQKLERDIDDN